MYVFVITYHVLFNKLYYTVDLWHLKIMKKTNGSLFLNKSRKDHLVAEAHVETWINITFAALITIISSLCSFI